MINTFFSVLPPNNHENSDLDAGGRIMKTRKTDRASKLRHESSGDTSNIIFISPCRVEF